MRYKTAAVLSAVWIAMTGGMFGLEAAARATFLPSLKQGLADPIPAYERVLVNVFLFCGTWKWVFALLALPTAVVLFTVAVFTSDSKVGKTAKPISRPTDPPPALWNPKAAAYWSLLFTPAFGAFLHAQNADAMNRADEARANRMWFYTSIAYVGFAFASIFMPILEGLVGLTSIGLLLGWYLSLAKKQVIYVKVTWEDGYERKSWKESLLIAFGCLIGTLTVFAVAEDIVLSSQ
jgi:hypothetical protein